MISVELDEDGNPKSAIDITAMVEIMLEGLLEEHLTWPLTELQKISVRAALVCAYRMGWAQCGAKAREKLEGRGALIGETEHGDKVYAVTSTPMPSVDLQVCWVCKSEESEASLRHMVGVGYACRDKVACRERRDEDAERLQRLDDDAPCVTEALPAGTPVCLKCRLPLSVPPGYILATICNCAADSSGAEHPCVSVGGTSMCGACREGKHSFCAGGACECARCTPLFVAPPCPREGCKLRLVEGNGQRCPDGHWLASSPVTQAERESTIQKLSAVQSMMDTHARDLANWKRRALQAESVVDTGDKLTKELLDLRNEVRNWRSLYLDKPEDRLYHASDNTWWRRDDARYTGIGSLVRAKPPKGWVELKDCIKVAETVESKNPYSGYNAAKEHIVEDLNKLVPEDEEQWRLTPEGRKFQRENKHLSDPEFTKALIAICKKEASGANVLVEVEKLTQKVQRYEEALRYCRSEAQANPKKVSAWAPAIIDRVNAALAEGAYAPRARKKKTNG